MCQQQRKKGTEKTDQYQEGKKNFLKMEDYEYTFVACLNHRVQN